MKYYSLDKILKYKAKYNIIISGRSDGKTYAVLKHILQNHVKTGKTGGIIRRFQDDFIGKRGQQMFSALVENGEIEKATDGKYNSVYYRASKWYLCTVVDGKMQECAETPFCYGFAITSQEHDKSTSYPTITTILFDEFITRSVYLPDEFVLFCNVLSTIIRQRDDVTIFMCGNTISKYCPYFDEMGLKHMNELKQGTIDIYQYGDSGLTIAVEYPDIGRIFKKKSNVYFAFDNPKLSMITGGQWEIEIYPHCPRKYRPCEIVFEFFIVFDSQTFHAEIVSGGQDIFVFVHPKTTELKNRESDLIYDSALTTTAPNIRRSFANPVDNLDRKILQLYRTHRFFYSDNETGDALKNFIASTV